MTSIQTRRSSRLTDYFSKSKRCPTTGKSPATKRVKIDEIDEMAAIGKQQSKLTTEKGTKGQTKRTRNTRQTTKVVPITPDLAATCDDTKISPRKRKTTCVVDGEQSVVISKVSNLTSNRGSARRKLQFAKRKNTECTTEQVEVSADTDLVQKLQFDNNEQQEKESPNNDRSSTEEVVKVSKEKVNKKKLSRVRNLDQLREQLSQFSDVAARLNQCQAERANIELKQLKTHLSPVKSAVKTKAEIAINEEETRLAYDRYRHLVEKNRSKLELPPDYSLLLEFFKGTDTVVSMMHRRDELITFDKVKSSVEHLVKRNYRKKHLGQIKTVYPEGYNFRIEKSITRFAVEVKSDKYDLIIEPNLENDLVNFKFPSSTIIPTQVAKQIRFSTVKLPSSPSKSPLHGVSPKKSAKKSEVKLTEEDEIAKLTGNRQVYRRTIFLNRLVEILKQHHRDYLSRLDPPIQLNSDDDSNLQRWHPNFLSSDIVEIPTASLPEIPINARKVCSARELLKRHEAVLPQKAKEALSEPDASVATTESPRPTAKPCNIKGVPQNLLEKVRAKQAEKERLQMLRNPVEEKRKRLISRLPDLVKILRTHYLCEKKASLPQNDLIRVIDDSYGSLLSKNDIEKHIDLLIEMAPGWISRSVVKGIGAFVKINKAVPLAEIEAMLK